MIEVEKGEGISPASTVYKQTDLLKKIFLSLDKAETPMEFVSRAGNLKHRLEFGTLKIEVSGAEQMRPEEVEKLVATSINKIVVRAKNLSLTEWGG